jgi:hypothetical protein
MAKRTTTAKALLRLLLLTSRHVRAVRARRNSKKYAGVPHIIAGASFSLLREMLYE